MEVSMERDDGVLSCMLTGRVDGDSADQLYETLAGEVSTDDTAVIADLSGVQFVSSAGLRSFVQLARVSDSRGVKFLVCGMTQGVREVFDVTGLSRIMPVFETPHDAEQSARQNTDTAAASEDV